MAYNTIPGIDELNQFPEPVREGIASAPELENKYAHLVEGVLVIGGTPVNIPGEPAGLDTVGWLQAVFIESGGVIPPGTPPYTLVIEMDT